MESKSIHSKSLDGLRFFAFLGVFLLHTFQFHPEYAAFPFVKHGGKGVTVFFVLSGFLIGRILIDLRDKCPYSLGDRLKSFYIRRALRIFPLYYAALIILYALPWPWSYPWQTFGTDALYLSNVATFWRQAWPPIAGHFWTLSVEEHFYLVVPLLVLILSPQRLETSIVVLWIVVAAARLVNYRLFWNRYFEILSPMQFDSLTIGVAAAIAQERGRFAGLGMTALRRIGYICVILFCIQMCEILQYRGAGNVEAVFSPFILSVSSAVLILDLWSGSWKWANAFLSLGPFVYLGKISYGLYVIHGPCITFMAGLFGTSDFSVSQASFIFALTVAVATTSWYLLERPVNELKRHFPYSRQYSKGHLPDESRRGQGQGFLTVTDSGEQAAAC